MKEVALTKVGGQKVKSGRCDLLDSDVENMSKGVTPGEWIILINNKSGNRYLGFVNPAVLAPEASIRIVEEITEGNKVNDYSQEFILKIINNNIQEAINYRNKFGRLTDGCRLIYGEMDRLPGLIVDKFQRNILIQINTAGLNKFRFEIKHMIQEKFSNHTVYLYDNEKYRKSESLPIFNENVDFPDKLIVKENDLIIKVPTANMQKIGYYYDHRINRAKMCEWIKQANTNLSSGLDLFSYVGSWGLNMLKAGLQNVRFVDQAQMEQVIEENLNFNFANKDKSADYIRTDVFKFLDAEQQNAKTYDVICCDPPAFCKTHKQKKQALQGYERLYNKILPILSKDSLLVAASCTKYISLEELDRVVITVAKKQNRKIRLIDLGIQGPDHIMTSLNDSSNYIKCLFYWMV